MPNRPADHISITFRGVEDLETYRRRRQVDAILPDVLDSLRRSGDATQHLDDPPEAGVWREAARVAGRRLGVHVRTGETACGCPDRDGVHVWVVNLDAEVNEADLRAALNRAAALVDGSPGVRRFRHRQPSPPLAPPPPPAGQGEDGRSDPE